MAAASETASPVALDQMERTGATRFGYAVRRVWLELADGRMVKAELPMASPAAQPAMVDVSLNNCQRKIIRYLATLDDDARVKGTLIADAIEESYTTIRKHLSDLLAKEVLSNDRSMDGYGRGKLFGQVLQFQDVP